MLRWEILPPSERSRAAAAKMMTTEKALVVDISHSDVTASSREALIMQIGEFLHQGLTETKRVTCSYRNLTEPDHPIQLICELGCCPTGCCAFNEYSQRGWIVDYNWALLLLAVFIACVVTSSLIMAFLRCFNRRRENRALDIKTITTANAIGDADTAYGSGHHLDFSSVYSQASTSSQISPHIYHCNVAQEQHNLPSFYPTTQTFKSAL